MAVAFDGFGHGARYVEGLAYLAGLDRRLPWAGRGLWWLDATLGALPVLRNAGDHFLMVLRKRE